MSQENSYSSIENNFNSLYSLNSSTDKNIEEYFSRNRFIPLKSPIFSSDEKRSTANDDISQEDSFSPILRNNSELFSSNKNAERNNIFKEENTNQKDTIDKDKVLNANEKCTKRTKDKTKNNKKPLFKIIGRKTRRYKKKYNILIKMMRNFFNKYLVEKINKIIRKSKSEHYFEKFPQKFVFGSIKKKNQKIWKMNLNQIFEENKYSQYLRIIEDLKKKENIEKDLWINIFLIMNISDIYDEYLDSIALKGIIEKLKIQYGEEYIEKIQNHFKNFRKN
jgi:hypothetical protein